MRLAIAVSFAAAHAVAEEIWSPCGDGRTEVAGTIGDEFASACSAATSTMAFLQNCGLSLPNSLRLEVARKPIKVDGNKVFGCFDAEKGVIRFLDQKGCAKAAAAAHKAYRTLPVDELYRSIITHEVAHRVLQSNLGGRALPRAAHEYVAYAVQISLMPQAVRSKFLTPIRRSPPSDLSRFGDMLLFMAPAVFGAMAYDHFSAAGNGCRFLRDLTQGEEAFPTADSFY